MNKNNGLFSFEVLEEITEQVFATSAAEDLNLTAPLYITEVKTRKEADLFLGFPDHIHKSNPEYIKPLNRDIEGIFNKKRNSFFQHGKCIRWLLFDDLGVMIGRIAAFVNNEYHQRQPTGGIGFFECVDSEAAAHFLFDHCKFWLEKQGVEAMDGPINFGERMNWWGLVLEGFHAPLYGMNYNPPYYQRLFDSYGFAAYFYQYCYSMDIRTALPGKFYRIKKKVAEGSSLKAVSFSKKKLKAFARDFSCIYNRSWESHGEGKSITESEAIKMFKKMKAVIDEKAVWFIYDQDQPVACWLNLPDLNAYFKSLNGKFGFFERIKFMVFKKIRPSSKLVGLLFGIVPEYQKKGIDAFMIVSALETIITKTKYLQYEMQWIGDFNPRMINIAKNMGSVCSRKLVTYRYLFDRSQSIYKQPKLA